MVKVAGMKFEIISVNFNLGVFEINNHFYPVSLLASVKSEEGVFVQAELIAHTLQSGRRFGHQWIVKQGAVVAGRTVPNLLVPECLNWVQARGFDGR